jgi:hypothetical protein
LIGALYRSAPKPFVPTASTGPHGRVAGFRTAETRGHAICGGDIVSPMDRFAKPRTSPRHAHCAVLRAKSIDRARAPDTCAPSTPRVPLEYPSSTPRCLRAHRDERWSFQVATVGLAQAREDMRASQERGLFDCFIENAQLEKVMKPVADHQQALCAKRCLCSSLLCRRTRSL